MCCYVTFVAKILPREADLPHGSGSIPARARFGFHSFISDSIIITAQADCHQPDCGNFSQYLECRNTPVFVRAPISTKAFRSRVAVALEVLVIRI